MKLEEFVSHLHKSVGEALDTRVDLDWKIETGGFTAEFFIEDRHYEISVLEEKTQTINAYRVDFHFITPEGKVTHDATGFQKDAFKVLGIVGNGVKEKFGKSADIIYFLAKAGETTNQLEHESRSKLYSRLAQKLARENSMHRRYFEYENSEVFLLTKKLNDIKEVGEILGIDLPY